MGSPGAEFDTAAARRKRDPPWHRTARQSRAHRIARTAYGWRAGAGGLGQRGWPGEKRRGPGGCRPVQHPGAVANPPRRRAQFRVVQPGRRRTAGAVDHALSNNAPSTMSRIRTLIVDDEALARDRLRQLLQKEPEVEIIGECSDGQEAVEAIRKTSPQLVFLDVQMPEL